MPNKLATHTHSPTIKTVCILRQWFIDVEAVSPYANTKQRERQQADKTHLINICWWQIKFLSSLCKTFTYKQIIPSISSLGRFVKDKSCTKPESTFSIQLCHTEISSAVTECTVCGLASRSIPFQLPALSHTTPENLFKTSSRLSIALQRCISKLPALPAKITQGYGCSILGFPVQF